MKCTILNTFTDFWHAVTYVTHPLSKVRTLSHHNILMSLTSQRNSSVALEATIILIASLWTKLACLELHINKTMHYELFCIKHLSLSMVIWLCLHTLISGFYILHSSASNVLSSFLQPNSTLQNESVWLSLPCYSFQAYVGCSWPFHINFRMSLLICTKKTLLGIALNLQRSFQRTGPLTEYLNYWSNFNLQYLKKRFAVSFLLCCTGEEARI